MNQKLFDKIDLRTLADLYEAQPVVSASKNEAATKLVTAIIEYSKDNSLVTEKDYLGTEYWMAPLMELVKWTGMGESLCERSAGPIFRSMGLVLHRRNDGTKVAWSRKQLEILVSIFKS